MLLGRRLSPFRLIIYGIILFTTITFFSSLSPVPLPAPATEALTNIQTKAKEKLGPHLPSWYESGGGAHKPPDPTNGTASTPSWYEHWTWLNRFGTSKDFSESRTVLPPLPRRCPIYAYYDQDVKKEGQTKTDDAVMLAWRRAWWAAGFEPIILSPSDARKHGMYKNVKGRLGGKSDKLEYNILRWLAWDRMGTGVLSDFRVFPMAFPGDPVIPFLRRCDYGQSVTRFAGLGSALFAADSNIIAAVVKNITTTDASTISADITSPVDLAPEFFTDDPTPASIAYYARNVVAEKYAALEPQQLPKLINAHLHEHFHSVYTGGIRVLNPIEESSDVLSLNMYIVAQKLSQCPDSPLPGSLSPQKTEEQQQQQRSQYTCDKDHVHITKQYINDTRTFTIGGIPHPMTLQGIMNNKLIPDLDWIRRNSSRDVYVKTVTEKIAENGTGAGYRAVKLKELIAASLTSSLRSTNSKTNGVAVSIWGPVEKTWDLKELEWTLGFTFPESNAPSSPQLRQDEGTVRKHKQIIEDSKRAVRATSTGLKKLRGAIEGWSLADFEVWKFVEAFEERRKSEREAWVKREKGFGKGLEKRGAFYSLLGI
ncbi:hypothetical protein TWF730_006424 [Orbilia blumenaviensis]|uniref:Uncharacterized protein n=1 Tax=Orbilia blumenaviensis TaxID=1796055 RepID=A0AAV9VH88_9PEZI